MKVIDWMKIINEVLALIAFGMVQADAVYEIAKKHKVSEEEILERM